MKKKILYILFILLNTINAFSQEQKVNNKDTAKSKQLEDVIVTANKREENIIKVNTSITSLSAKKIK